MNENNEAEEREPVDAKSVIGGIGLVLCLTNPVAMMIGFATYVAVSYGRIHYRVFAAALALYVAVLGLLSALGFNAFTAYGASFLEWARLTDGLTGSNAASIAGAFVAQQAIAGMFLGGLVGTVWSWWTWKRRPEWDEFVFRKTPWQLLRKRRVIEDIRNDRATPRDGRTIGVDEDGNRVNQSEREGRAHTVIIGASGSGKTTTILNGCRDQIKRGEGLVFVDMKGSTDVPEVLAMYAKRYGRTFRHWTATQSDATYTGPAADGPSFYNPLGRGDATRRKDLLIAGRKWEGGAEHYKSIIGDYLQRAFEVILGTPELMGTDAFAEILDMLDPQSLKRRSLSLPSGDPLYTQIQQEVALLADKRLERDVASTLSSMRSQYGGLAQSVQGRWLKGDPVGKRDINLFDAAHNGEVIVFSVDSSNYEDNSRVLGNFIIQDLKTVSSELRHDPAEAPLNVIIDEFAAIGSDNIINLVNKSRDAKMPVSLSTQSLGDLLVVSPAFMAQLTGIVSSFIIHRANSIEDAKVYSGLTPMVQTVEFMRDVSHSTNRFGGIKRGRSTGKGRVTTIEKHMVDPADIQELGAGQAFYICKDPSRVERVQVIVEAGALANSANDGKAAPPPRSVSRSMPPLLLNDGESLANYAVKPSENYVRSMEVERQEREAEAARQAQGDALSMRETNERRADPARLRRMGVNVEVIDGVSVRKQHPDFTPAERTVVRKAPLAAKPYAVATIPARNPAPLPDLADEDTQWDFTEATSTDPASGPDQPQVAPVATRSLALPEIDDDEYREESVRDIFDDFD